MAGLTKLKIDRLTKPGRYGDGCGLWLQVSKFGTKSWLLRYAQAGKARHMGLGALELVSLAEARDLALAARRQLRDGVDPIEARKAALAQQRLAIVATMTFRQAAKAALEAREAGWDNREHRRQWQRSLEQYAYPTLGDMPVAGIDAALVVACLQPIWNTKRTTAERLRGRIEAVLNWATAAGRRQGENPARWRANLEHMLATDRALPVHHAALPYDDISAFMTDLRGRPGMTARALEFVVLTAARTGEALGAQWDEIKGDEWTVPPARMKGRKDARKEHRVPLSGAALALLASLPRIGAFVFAGARADRPLHSKSLGELLRGMKVDATVHGMRSVFKDWAAESTGYANEISEQALAHAIPNKVEGAYRRGDMFEKRRRLMEDWAVFCTGPVVAKGEVVPIRGVVGHG